jgi:DNA-directed RNA polymerase specialized sigma24 family protein
LAARIDAERPGRELLVHLARLSARNREVVELVDIAGLTPTEAALALGTTPGALRVRLFRARARLRKGA